MDIDLSTSHTWYLIYVMLLRAIFQYHSGGISAGRSPMSYVYDAWSPSCVSIDQKVREEVSLEMLIGELHSRPPLSLSGEQKLFTGSDLAMLTFVELTSLAVNAMSRGHIHMRDKQDWLGLSTSFQAVEGVREYFGVLPHDQDRFLPIDMFDRPVSSAAHYVELKSLVDELKKRCKTIYIDQFLGLKTKVGEIQSLPD